MSPIPSWCGVCYGLTIKLANGKCKWWRDHPSLINQRMARLAGVGQIPDERRT